MTNLFQNSVGPLTSLSVDLGIIKHRYEFYLEVFVNYTLSASI